MRNLIKTKKISVLVLSLCAALCAFFGFAPQMFSAKAEATTLDGFTLKGASIRYSTDTQVGTTITDDTDGIRFGVSITNKALGTITENGDKEITEAGILLAKGNISDADEADVAAVLTANMDKAKQVAVFDGKYDATAAEDTIYEYNVAVYDISDKSTRYAFLGYITVEEETTGETTTYVTEEAQIRSPLQVAAKFKDNAYTNSNGTVASAAQQEYVNGVINSVTQGVSYQWDESTASYYVAGIADENALTEALGTGTDKVLRVLSTYDTIDHKKAAVTYLGESSLRNNTTITHLILPENVTEIKPYCCMNMSALKYVYMPGVKTTAYSTNAAGASLDGGSYQFRLCNLDGIVVKDIRVSSVMCIKEESVKTNHTKVYVVEGGNGITFGDAGWMNSNVNLAQVDGTVKSIAYNANGTCGTWKYAENGYTVVEAAAAHTYENGACTSCGAAEPVVYDTMGVAYAYDSITDSYYVSGVADADAMTEALGTGTDKVLRILATYDDGTNDVKAVTYLGAHCLQYSTDTTSQYHIPVLATITHLILPESVKTLKTACCQGMSALKYVSMIGVQAIYGSTSGNAQFRYCASLETVIVNQGLNITTNVFISETGGIPANQVQVYALQAGGSFPFGNNDGGYIKDNVGLKTVGGAHTDADDDPDSALSVLVQGVDWQYAEDGYNVELISAA